MTILIHGAKVWLGTGKGWSQSDVLVDGDKIAKIGPNLDVEALRRIDATGKWLIPGVIDPQVHFREPGNTYKEDLATGSTACVAGGVTTFFEMPNTDPATITADLMRQKQELAASKCLANFAFFVGATNDNVAELNAATGVCGIKIFMGSSTGSLLVHEQQSLERIFAETDPKRVIALHCEDEARILERAKKYKARRDAEVHSIVRDHEAALLATRRAVDLAGRYQHRTHILHVSTGQEVTLLKNAPECVTSECAPHHLLFNINDYAELGGLIKMNPSLKGPEDNAMLWQGLLEGTIDCVATDHAPHT
ncbi:MAG: amidohydrolase family protein, partial [Planctomycetes bacterium]|nr:amidohydrolase family protein [Planctomycetota bacterium]